jgi:two-component system KDP operon response regulator KdpE
MTERTILVVDDEPQVHRFLRPALEAEGYVALRADTAADGLHLAETRHPAAILLDLGLPDMDGQDALGKLRAVSTAPVIVVSARDREAEKIRALDGGADDYVEKPFVVGELLARLRACLRRTIKEEGAEAVWHRGGVEIDLVRRRVKVDGHAVMFTPLEYDLLALLVRSAGRVVTHRQLLTSVWGKAHADDVQYLRVYIGHIRQKLGEGGAFVGTEPGVGYRFAEAEAEQKSPSP